MKHRSPHFSARSRILLIATLAIIVPTVVLSLFGFKLINEQETFKEERFSKFLRTTAELTVDSIIEKVEMQEKQSMEGLPLGDPEKLRARLETIEKNSGLVEQAFLLRGSDEVLYPVVELPPYNPPPARLPAADELTIPGMLKEGYAKEFTENNIDAALELYGQYRRRIMEWYAKVPEAAPEAARAIQEVASALFRAGRFEDAITEYAVLAESADFEKVDFRHSLLARYQIAQALWKLDRRAEVIQKLLGLYDFLITVQPRSGDGPLVDFFRGRVLKDLDSLAAGGLGEQNQAKLELMKKQDARRQRRLEFLDGLKKWWELQQGLEQNPTLGELRHSKEPKLMVCYKIVKLRPDDTDYSMVGFKLKLDYLMQNIALPQLKTDEFSTVTISVVDVADGNQRVLYGPPPVKDPREVVVGFPPPFSSWQIHAVDADPESYRSRARRLTWVYASLNIVIVVVIVAGVYLTIKDMNRELEISRLKSDFVSNVSHELKTPLSLIRMFSETLLMGRVKEERRQEYYTVINKESERLTALINNVLDFSKIDAGRRSYDMAPAHIADVIENMLAAYRYDLQKEQFTVDVEIEPDVPETLLDDDAIAQALLNLLSNAVKYSRDEKYIKVSACQRNGMIHVSVIDHGIGISEENQRRLFEMFFRASDEKVRSTRGTGLGLAITRHTVEAHGGTVSVESTEGEGSTFTISLPIRPVGGRR